MTELEIMDLEAGRELDALIAEKVLGWHWVTGILAFDHPCLISPERYEEKAFYVKDTNSHGNYIGLFAKYSTEIAAAWELVKEMESRDIGFSFGSVIPNSDPIVYEAQFDLFEVAVEFTEPLAICKAALFAVEKVWQANIKG
jgi:hypothetical protein